MGDISKCDLLYLNPGGKTRNRCDLDLEIKITESSNNYYLLL